MSALSAKKEKQKRKKTPQRSEFILAQANFENFSLVLIKSPFWNKRSKYVEEYIQEQLTYDATYLPSNPKDKSSPSWPGVWNCLRRSCPGGRGVE